MEWLSSNSMEEIYIFCCSHAQEIQDHLEATGWLSSRRIAVHTVVSTNCMSVGDALRLLDHKDVIKTDFVLVTGDVVSNIRLSEILDAHTKRRSADKSAIMTMLMRPDVSLEHRARIGDDASYTMIDPTTNRLLKYEEIPLPPLSINKRGKGTAKDQTEPTRAFTRNDESREPSNLYESGETSPSVSERSIEDLRALAESIQHSKFVQARRKVCIEASNFSERDELQIRFDLMDIGIYVCAPEVLMLFSDNFDYQNIRKDFVSGVLSEEELGNKLYVHEIKKVSYSFSYQRSCKKRNIAGTTATNCCS